MQTLTAEQSLVLIAQALMARRAPKLPTHYAGKLIRSRIPYAMPGELIVTNSTAGNQFPDATFQSGIDKPFECDGMRISIVPFESGAAAASTNQVAVIATEPNVQRALDKFVRVMVEHKSANERAFRGAHVVETLIDYDTRKWPWHDVMTIERGSGWTVTVDSIMPATFTINDVVFDRVRVDVAFTGNLLVVENASEQR